MSAILRPITSLLAIDKVRILHDIYHAVTIPPAVAKELMAHHKKLPSFIDDVKHLALQSAGE